MKSIIVAGASLFSLANALASVAQAQEADSAPASQATADEAGGVGDIVVTAQRRAENIQDVPISVTAVTGDSLTAAGIDSSAKLSNLVPGLVFTKTGTNGVPYIRGAGQNAGAAGLEPPVATYIDGVYIPSSAATVLSLNNIDQIAVLKGPQGTLFGRNTTGGVIQITTRTPGSTPGYDLDAGYARFNTVQARGYVQVPLTDTISTSAAMAYLNQGDGWGRNITLGTELYKQKSFVAQGKTVFNIQDSTRLVLNGIYSRMRDGTGNTPSIAEDALGSDGITRYTGEYIGTAPFDTSLRVSQYLGSATLTHEFGGVDLQVLGSVHHYSDDLIITPAPLPLGLRKSVSIPFVNSATTYSNEVQLKSHATEGFSWIVGYYYLNNFTKSSVTTVIDLGAIGNSHGRQKLISHAVFGEAGYDILSNLRLTLGARYTIDRKSLDGDQLARGVFKTASQLAVEGGFSDKKTWKMPTFKAAIDYKPSDDVMLYASYNRGFKSGIYNLSTLTNPPADPEKVDSFEVGFKSLLFDRKLRFNVDAFYADYKDLQIRTLVPLGVTFLLNAAKARSKGIDADFQAALTSQLTASGGVTFLDAKYLDFPRAVCSVQNKSPTGALTGGNTTGLCDRSGGRMMRAPKVTGNIGLQYTVPLEGSNLGFSVTDSYNSGFYWEPDNRRRQNSYHSVSASASWQLDSGFYVRVWGANLANERIRSHFQEGGDDTFSAGAPRTYGITVGVKRL